MASTPDTVRIHYRRPPDREDVFEQRLIHRDPSCIITFLERTPVAAPVLIDDRPVLERESPAVWFTFPGEWHDVGLFHLADERPTGTYANILTPVRFIDELTWETTDLYLDVWLDPEGNVRVLDEDEFEAARKASVIEPALADRARREADRLLEQARTGVWPPPIVRQWTLDRIRRSGVQRPDRGSPASSPPTRARRP